MLFLYERQQLRLNDVCSHQMNLRKQCTVDIKERLDGWFGLLREEFPLVFTQSNPVVLPWDCLLLRPCEDYELGCDGDSWCWHTQPKAMASKFVLLGPYRVVRNRYPSPESCKELRLVGFSAAIS